MNQKKMITFLVLIVVILGGVLGCTVATKEEPTAQTPEQKTITPPTTDSPTTLVENKTVDWKLVSGDPNDTCTSPTYKGEAQIKGWYVFDYGYVDKEWLLQIADEDVKKIPITEVYGEESYNKWVKRPLFFLHGTTPEIEEELKNSSREKPKTITVKGFSAYCEGAPSLSIQGF